MDFSFSSTSLSLFADVFRICSFVISEIPVLDSDQEVRETDPEMSPVSSGGNGSSVSA